MKHPTKALLKKREKRKLKKEFKSKLSKCKNKIIERDNYHCQKCNKDLSSQMKHVHHIVSLQSVKRMHPELLEDTLNGILLCSYCHKFAPDSPHQGGFEFVEFFKNKFPDRYEYLINKLKSKKF